MWFSLFLFLFGSDAITGQDFRTQNDDPTRYPKTVWSPKGERIKCTVIKDTWISSLPKEKYGNNGGSRRLKVKGQQEYTLLDIDPSPLKGKLITGALLHIRSATPDKAPLYRLGVSAISSKWTEGTSQNYHPEKGSSCFVQAEYKERNWAYPGSTIMDVTFGRGHTIWKFADCSPPDQQGWQTCAVDPDVVAARVAGLSHGFFIYDEVGNIWFLKKGEFEYTYFPNRFCYSRESGKSGPWLEVWAEGTDTTPPETVSSIEVDIQNLPASEALVYWKTPKDSGGGKTLGFQLSYTKDGQEKTIPRYLIPMAGKTGEEVRMHIQDLPFKAGELILLTIKPIDSAGNIGKPFAKTIRLASGSQLVNIPEADVNPFPPSNRLLRVGNLNIAVVDMLDKIDPQNGSMIPSRKRGYKGGNHIYSDKKKRIRLYSARNETVAFHLNLEGKAKNISVNYRFNQNPGLKPKIFQFAYVNIADKKGKDACILPDPLVPLEGTFSIPSTVGEVQVPGQTNHSLVCELYVPHEEPPGKKRGKVFISTGQERLELDIVLTVWNFTLPNKLSFIPEMNAYGTVSPYGGYDYYRLAHEHRTCINRLPYGWNGKPSFAPKWHGNGFDWFTWDKKVGPLLDGSAFKDMPRKNEPLDVFYLPFNENWPVNIFDHYSPSYWADEAFDARYMELLQKAFAGFAKHCNEKGWHNTILQFYLNNKVYYRAKYDRTSAPWLFDEPMNTQDFWALRWYGLLWHSAVDPIKGFAKMWYRGDVSYSQFGRDILWGVMDVEYLGGNNAQKTRMKHDEQILHGKSYFAEYGTANKIKDSNTQPVLWCLSAWAKGEMAVLPWQTIGSKNCWKIAEQTALFYPQPDGPKPSIRLKAFTRGQQFVEYLTLLCDTFKMPRYAVANWLGGMIDVEGAVSKAYIGDAGTLEYNKVDPIKLWEIRYRVGKMLSDKAPAYRRSLVDWESPKWDANKLPEIGYVRVSPKVRRYMPDCDSFRPQ